MAWRDVNEKKPKRGQRIVVMRGDGEPFAGQFCDQFPDMLRCIDRRSGKFWYGWQLWMPIPKTPIKQEAAGHEQ